MQQPEDTIQSEVYLQELEQLLSSLFYWRLCHRRNPLELVPPEMMEGDPKGMKALGIIDKVYRETRHEIWRAVEASGLMELKEGRRAASPEQYLLDMSFELKEREDDHDGVLSKVLSHKEWSRWPYVVSPPELRFSGVFLRSYQDLFDTELGPDDVAKELQSFLSEFGNVEVTVARDDAGSAILQVHLPEGIRAEDCLSHGLYRGLPVEIFQ